MIGWLLSLTMLFVIFAAFSKTKIRLLEEEIEKLKKFKIVIYDSGTNKGGTHYEFVDNDIRNHTLYNRD